MLPSDTGDEATAYVEKEIPIGEIVGRATGAEPLWIDQRRPGYAEEERWVQFLDQCYEGGDAYLKANNLTPFLIERSDTEDAGPDSDSSDATLTEEYKIRKQQSSRFNVVAELINSLCAFLAGRSPVRKYPKDKYLDRFIEATDLSRSMTMDEFSLEGARRLLLHGACFTAVDMALTDEALRNELSGQGIPIQTDDRGFLSMSEVVKSGLGDKVIPHSFHVDPSNVLNGYPDAAGDLDEILIRETVHNGKSLKTGKSAYITQYRLITKTDWELFVVRKQGNVRELLRIGNGANPLGFVNVIVKRLRPKGADPFRGISFVEDWAYIDRTVYDLLSAFGWNLKENSATQMFVTGNLSHIMDPDLKRKEIVAAQKAAKSPCIVLGMDAKIGSVEKNFDQAGLLLDGVERLTNFVFKLTGFRDKISESAAPESGEARLRAFAVLNAHLTAVGRVLGPTERFQLKTADGFLGLDMLEVGMDASVYPRSYDVRAVEDDITLMKELWGKAPPEFLKAVLSDLARKLFAEKTPEWLNQLDKAIDLWDLAGSSQAEALGGEFGQALGKMQSEADALNQRAEAEYGADSKGPPPELFDKKPDAGQAA